GKPLLVILDGLDETLGWDIDHNMLPPSGLPGIRFVAAARPWPGSAKHGWAHHLHWPSPEALTLTCLDREGIDDLIAANSQLQELDRQVQIGEILFELTKGDPLLLHLYIEDWQKYIKEPSTFDRRRLETIPSG